ncbi:MAG: aldo/keto reductase [Proteobacteria bacterium]|nr:aldo/keto reductase [Pseudomonadota bacterium]
MSSSIERRRLLLGGAALSAALAAAPVAAQTGPAMHKRKIPATGEMLGVIGCGTWQTFDVGSSPAERAPLAEVLKVLFEGGGSVIDSSPMYGRSEGVAGDLLAAAGTRDKAFIATKVWTSGRDAGIAQMEQSLKRFHTDRIDLMQIHNLLDWQTHLPILRAWKKEGRIRLIGVTHYTESGHDALEATLRTGGFDFVQINYAIDDRGAERSLLKTAADKGVAVLINRPFGGGGLLRKLSSRPLPGWAAEIGCMSWAQVLLKFVLAHPAVTCAIPGTSKPEHMRQNIQAGTGFLPDAGLLQRMIAETGG